MKKNFAIILALVFLGAQMLSFQHMAEHGFKEHAHKGNPCQISVYYNQSHSFDSATNTAAIAIPQNHISFSYSFANIQPVLSFAGYAKSPRAPPFSA